MLCWNWRRFQLTSGSLLASKTNSGPCAISLQCWGDLLLTTVGRIVLQCVAAYGTDIPCGD
jgi:hypothetical protein